MIFLLHLQINIKQSANYNFRSVIFHNAKFVIKALLYIFNISDCKKFLKFS